MPIDVLRIAATAAAALNPPFGDALRLVLDRIMSAAPQDAMLALDSAGVQQVQQFLRTINALDDDQALTITLNPMAVTERPRHVGDSIRPACARCARRSRYAHPHATTAPPAWMSSAPCPISRKRRFGVSCLASLCMSLQPAHGHTNSITPCPRHGVAHADALSADDALRGAPDGNGCHPSEERGRALFPRSPSVRRHPSTRRGGRSPPTHAARGERSPPTAHDPHAARNHVLRGGSVPRRPHPYHGKEDRCDEGAQLWSSVH